LLPAPLSYSRTIIMVICDHCGTSVIKVSYLQLSMSSNKVDFSLPQPDLCSECTKELHQELHDIVDKFSKAKGN